MGHLGPGSSFPEKVDAGILGRGEVWAEAWMRGELIPIRSAGVRSEGGGQESTGRGVARQRDRLTWNGSFSPLFHRQKLEFRVGDFPPVSVPSPWGRSME